MGLEIRLVRISLGEMRERSSRGITCAQPEMGDLDEFLTLDRRWPPAARSMLGK
jgi:hypothetical protein